MAEWSGRWGMLVASWGDALRDESPRRGRKSLSRSTTAPSTSRSLSRTREGSFPARALSPEPKSLNQSQTKAAESGLGSWWAPAQTASVLQPGTRTRSKSPVNAPNPDRAYTPLRSKSPADRNPVPSAQRMLKLEMENLVLRVRTGEAEEEIVPIHAKHLQSVDEENTWLDSQILETKNKVERRKLFAEVAGASTAPNEVESTGPGWTTRLQGLERELSERTERRREIQDTYEARALELHKQLQQSVTQVNQQSPQMVSYTDVQQETALESDVELQKLFALRNELQQQFLQVQREARESQELDTINVVSSNPVVLQLRDEVESLVQDLDELKRAAMRESQMHGSNRFQSVQSAISKMTDEINQNSQALNDERVCFESELQELKNKARVLEDSLDSAKRELYYWREKANQEEEANASPQHHSSGILLADVEQLRAEHTQFSQELEGLQRMEEEQKRTIEDLKTEMDVLERQALKALDRSLSGECKVDHGDEYPVSVC